MKLHHSVAHALGQPRAREVLEQAFGHYQARHPHARLARTWLSDSDGQIEMFIGGFHLRATVRVSDRDVAVDLDVPLLARPFVPKIRDRLDREIGDWLRKADNT